MEIRLEELVGRCRAGDELAWRELVNGHAGLVLAVARRHGLSPADCEDVCQHAFGQLFRHLPSVREPRTLPAWLITTTSREASRIAQRRTPGSLDLDPQSPALSPSMDGLERHQRVRAAVDELGPRCRDLVRQLFFEDPPAEYATISARTGIPIGSIGPTRTRCLAKLAQILGELAPQ